MNQPVVSPVLNIKVGNEGKNRMKMIYSILAFLFFVFAIAFFLYVVLYYGKTSQPGKVNTTKIDNTIVSSPGIAVGEPNPNTPIPVESELTYTYPDAHGFSFRYTAADWTVTQEPTQLNNYDPTASSSNRNDLRLESTTDSNNSVTFFFTKAISGIISGNPIVTCSDNYKILIDQGPLGSDGGDANKGLIRMVVPGNNTVYARFYYQSSSEPSKMCIYTSHPIYFYEKVAGGESNQVPDTNDIYWIVSVSASPDNTELTKIDEMVKTITFAE